MTTEADGSLAVTLGRLEEGQRHIIDRLDRIENRLDRAIFTAAVVAATIAAAGLAGFIAVALLA